MKKFWDTLFFRRMISPILLQILFWAGVGGTLYGAYVLFKLDNSLWPIALIFGTIGVRVIFESAILAFQSFARLGHIHDELVKLNDRTAR